MAGSSKRTRGASHGPCLRRLDRIAGAPVLESGCRRGEVVVLAGPPWSPDADEFVRRECDERGTLSFVSVVLGRGCHGGDQACVAHHAGSAGPPCRSSREPPLRPRTTRGGKLPRDRAASSTGTSCRLPPQHDGHVTHRRQQPGTELARERDASRRPRRATFHRLHGPRRTALLRSQKSPSSCDRRDVFVLGLALIVGRRLQQNALQPIERRRVRGW